MSSLPVFCCLPPWPVAKAAADSWHGKALEVACDADPLQHGVLTLRGLQVKALESTRDYILQALERSRSSLQQCQQARRRTEEEASAPAQQLPLRGRKRSSVPRLEDSSCIANPLQARADVMRDLELRLEAASENCALPLDCYAAVRSTSGGPHKPLASCTPGKAICLGDIGSGEGPIQVDIFQRVGSISIGLPELGASAEAVLALPGLAQGALAVKATLVAAGAPATLPSFSDSTSSGLPSVDEGEGQHFDAMTEVAPDPEAREILRERANSVTQFPPPRRVSVEGQVFLDNCDQIIPFLYLGGVQAAVDKELLVLQGVQAVCCCLRELEYPAKDFAQEVDYYRVDVEDISREPVELFFPEATEFIHSWVSREQPVLVHCRAGVSRSASIVIAYLMTYHSFSLHDAFFLVRSRRNIITPNIGFMEKLGEYEEQIHETEATVDINKYISWYHSPESERAAVPNLRPEYV